MAIAQKLRSALKKKMNSFGNSSSSKNLSRKNSAASSSSSTTSDDDYIEQQQRTLQTTTVYVGKSLREYQVPVELLNHPVIKELTVDDTASESNVDQDCSVIIGCEVVLFDHLCWMLQQNSAAGTTGHQIEDLAALYAY